MSVIIQPVHSSALNFFSWRGIDLSSGLIDDSYITITPNATLTSATQDAGGRSRSISVDTDPSGKLEFNLQMQSTANLELMGVVREQRRNGGIPVFGDFVIGVGNTLYLYQPKQCHIMERPTQTVSKLVDGVGQTWTFDSADLNEIDVDSYVDLDVDLKASIKANIDIAFTLNI